MAENPRYEHVQAKPTFFARVLAIPFIHDIIAYILGHYQNIKNVHGGIKIIFSATEHGVHFAFSCFWLMITPLVSLVGCWDNVDNWACQVLDRIEVALPAIKRPVPEVVNDMRQKLLDSVAGENEAHVRPDTLVAALQIRLNTMTEKLRGSSCCQPVVRTGDGMLNRMHSILDTHSPEPEEDRQDFQNKDSHTKATALPIKARKILLEASGSKVTLTGEPSEERDQVLTTIEMVRLGQRQASLVYQEVEEEPSKFVILLTLIVCLICITAVRFATFLICQAQILCAGSCILIIPQLFVSIVLNILYQLGFFSALAKIQETLFSLAIWLKHNAIVVPGKKLLIILERVTREIWRIIRQPLSGIVDCLSPAKVDNTK